MTQGTSRSPLTDSQLRATAVPVSGPLTDTQLRATPVDVLGPLTDTELRAAAVPVITSGLTSTVNSSTATLAGAATFTGTGEQNNFPDAFVQFKSDVAGTLYFDFSIDGTNWDSTYPTAGFACAAGVPEVHVARKAGRYLRVRYINGAAAQSYMRLATYYGEYGALMAALNQSVSTDTDATVIRQINDPFLDYSRGSVGGRSIVNKFGRNGAIGSTEVVISRTNTTYAGFLTAAATVRVKAGGNAADTAAGVGAQSVTIVGLDANWAEYSETVATAGAGASAATTGTFIRIFRAYVGDCGTYSNGVSGSNTGDIDIETSGGALLCRIAATLGQSQLAAYTVPAGKTAYLLSLAADVDSTKACTVRMYQRRNADDATTPFSPRRLIHVFSALVSEATQNFKVYPSFPAKTDIWVTGQMDSAVTGAVNASFDLILVDDV